MRRLVVVTGGNGFIARHLARRLEQESVAVCRVSRSGAGDASWDQVWNGSLDWSDVAVVFHLAAFIPPGLEDSSFAGECLEHNALLTLRLAERAAQAGPVRFIYASTGQVYGCGSSPVCEDYPIEVTGRACFYLSSKLLGETYLERTRRQYGLDAVTLRIGSCYGPGMPAKSVIGKFAELSRQRQPLPIWNGGGERYDMVEVTDVVEILIRAAGTREAGVFHVGTGRNPSVSEIGETVNRVFGSSAGLVQAGGTAAQPGFAALDMTKSRAAFGWLPCEIEAGIRRYRTWLESL